MLGREDEFEAARGLIDNEDAQKGSQKEQDGSEIRSVALERLIAEGLTLIERRNSMELFRDMAADHFERSTGSPGEPGPGFLGDVRGMIVEDQLDRRIGRIGGLASNDTPIPYLLPPLAIRCVYRFDSV
jgi:hypothetical protein